MKTEKGREEDKEGVSGVIREAARRKDGEAAGSVFPMQSRSNKGKFGLVRKTGRAVWNAGWGGGDGERKTARRREDEVALFGLRAEEEEHEEERNRSAVWKRGSERRERERETEMWGAEGGWWGGVIVPHE